MNNMLEIEGINPIDVEELLSIGRNVLKQVRFSCAEDTGLTKRLNNTVAEGRKLNELDPVYDAFYDDVERGFAGSSEKMEWSCEMTDYIFRHIGTYGRAPLSLAISLEEFRRLRDFLKDSSKRYKHGGKYGLETTSETTVEATTVV